MIGWGGVIGAGALAYLLAYASSTAGASIGKASSGWSDGDAPRRIRALAEKVSSTGFFDSRELGDFLVLLAYGESRGNSRAVGPSGDYGWFQMLAPVALARDLESYSSAGGELLHNEAFAVTAAAYYVYRLQRYTASGRPVTWGEIRLGWKRPGLMNSGETAERSRLMAKFRGHARNAGVDPRILDREVFVGDYPGVLRMLQMVGYADV